MTDIFIANNTEVIILSILGITLLTQITSQPIKGKSHSQQNIPHFPSSFVPKMLQKSWKRTCLPYWNRIIPSLK